MELDRHKNDKNAKKAQNGSGWGLLQLAISKKVPHRVGPLENSSINKTAANTNHLKFHCGSGRADRVFSWFEILAVEAACGVNAVMGKIYYK